jgi:large conductance mechanosensitive channel
LALRAKGRRFKSGSAQQPITFSFWRFILNNNLINQSQTLVIGVLHLTKEDDMLAELRKIREAVEKAPPPQQPKGLWNEFKDFLSKYKILGLAVAFVLGLYLGALVQSLVVGFIMPLIGLALPVNNLSTLKFGVPATIFDAQGNPPAGYTGQVFDVGSFLVALITFLIVAVIVFLVVKVAKKWHIE